MSYDRINVPKPVVRQSVISKIDWDFVVLLSIWTVALLITGLSDFVRAGFDPDILFTPEWWFRIFRSGSTNLLVFLGTLFYLIKQALREEPSILESEEEVNELVKKHLDPITFDVFLPEFNRERKKLAYKKGMVQLHNKVDSKISKKPKVLELWANHLKEPEAEKWKEHKLTTKKYYLLEQMKEDYIEDNIDSIKVSYTPLTKKFVTNGYTHTKDYDDYHVEPTSRKLFFDLAPRLLFTLLLVAVLQTIFIEALEQESRMVAFVWFLINTIPLLFQIVLVFGYLPRFIEEKVLLDFRTRKDVMINYLAYLKRQKEVSNA